MEDEPSATSPGTAPATRAKPGGLTTRPEVIRTWYVTFEVAKRGLLKQRRHPRLTMTFETELEARLFAQEKLNEGLIVFAGTINPYRPKQLVTSDAISLWAQGAHQPCDESGAIRERDRT